MTAGYSNRELIGEAARYLGDLCHEVVFLGGATTGLLLTDTAAGPVRSTLDVDVITEVASRSDYYVLEERLRKAGFSHDHSEDAPICRWRQGRIILDVMPTASGILGFSNRWYAEAFRQAKAYTLENGLTIRLVTAPYFLATKMEAFRGRGNNDYMASRDMEDIITLIDGRPELLASEMAASASELRRFIADEISKLLGIQTFLDALPGHLPPDEASQKRLPVILQRLRNLAQLTK